MRQALVPTVAVVATGLAGAAVLARFVEHPLFRTAPLEPGAFATTAAVLLTVAVLAAAAPAIRMSAGEPIEVLRLE
jgi:hypothetical protein